MKESQHTVSKFYLRRFTPLEGDRILWKYPRNGGDPRFVSPKKATTRSHFYSHRNRDGSWNDSVEDILGDVENAAAPVLEKLGRGARISAQERWDVSVFLGTLQIRTEPYCENFRDHNDVLEASDVQLQFVERERRRMVEMTSEADVQALEERLRNGDTIPMDNRAYAGEMLARGQQIAQRLVQMSWELLRVRDGDFFIASDNPAFVRKRKALYSPGIVGIDRKDLDIEFGLALDSSTYLLARWASDGPSTRSVAKIPALRVQLLNRRTILSADKFVFSPVREESVRELIHSERAFRLEYPQVTKEEFQSLLATRSRST